MADFNGETDCGNCMEKFNKSNRKKVECPYCDYKSCSGCFEAFWETQSEDPYCMGCRKVWNREVLLDRFSKKFVNGTMKERKEQILYEKEIALLPSTQAEVERYQAKEKGKNTIKRLEEKKKKLLEDPHMSQVANGTFDPIYDKKELKKVVKMHLKIEKLNFMIHNYRRLMKSKTTQITKEKKEFIMPCPADGCRGFLSQGWKCGLCETKVCSKCHCIKINKDHECKKEDVETAETIANETKPCPSCATRIFKVSGCDQMYCTNCHTAFSWRTGRKETGVVHNPHYFEYMRTHGTQLRVVGDVQCGGIDQHALLEKARTLPKVQGSVLENVVLQYLHIQNGDGGGTLGYYRPDIVASNQDIRIKYMLKTIDEKKFKMLLQKRAKEREKKSEMFNVIQTLQTVTVDILQRFSDGYRVERKTKASQKANVELATGTCKELQELRDFTNQRLMKVADLYGSVKLTLNDKWKFEGCGVPKSDRRRRDLEDDEY